jgi:hypothetical protein
VPGSHPFQLPTDAKVAATNAIKGRQASTAGLPTIKPTTAWPKGRISSPKERYHRSFHRFGSVNKSIVPQSCRG